MQEIAWMQSYIQNSIINELFFLSFSLSQRNMTTLAVCWSRETSRLNTRTRRTWRIIKNTNDLLNYYSSWSPGLRRPPSRIVKPQQENPLRICPLPQSYGVPLLLHHSGDKRACLKAPAVLTVLLPKQTNSLSEFPVLFLSALDTSP